MQLNDIAPSVGFKKSKRVGRGPGSGHGKTSCRGHKGAKARSGRHWFIGMEGGNVPMFRKMPRFGFKHEKNVEFQIVNLKDLEERFDNNATVDPQALFDKNLIKNPLKPVKVLGNGKLSKKFTVSAHKYSSKAQAAIEATGGKVACLSL
jgi:large subunit ribosomal protein L15